MPTLCKNQKVDKIGELPCFLNVIRTGSVTRSMDIGQAII